jgi:predicted glycoside hydrolase/deacetylase ChbG (UPF0249 family)
MKRFIINADDCGKSPYVDSCIENAIKQRRITSTTIMANMDDFKGAVSLYKEYKDLISFGWHINLTEGKPLHNSDLLLEIGFYKEVDGTILLNGHDYWKKYIRKDAREEIKKELKAQYEKLSDYGIKICHADGHHHIHTAPSMILMISELIYELKIEKCRRKLNYVSSFSGRFLRNACMLPYTLRGIRMPDTFCSYMTYHQNPSLTQGDTIELMCHPGHPASTEETKLLNPVELTSSGAKLITYKEL